MTIRRIEVGSAGGFDVHRFVGDLPGLRVVVLGGVHGDETEGAMAAARIAAASWELTHGVLDVVPVCHEAAFQTDSRVSPIDGENLARVFPGDLGASPTSVLAHWLFREVLEGADLLVDLHTSGQSYDMPFLAGFRGGDDARGGLAERAATAFGADFVWRHPNRSVGRTTSVVENALYVESPGWGPTNLATISAYVTGVERVLDVVGLRSGPRRRSEPQIRVVGGGDLDRDMLSVSHDGVFLATVARGERISEDQPLGSVLDVAGRKLEEIVSRSSGYVMAIKRRSPVRSGDLVLNIAVPEDTAAIQESG